MTKFIIGLILGLGGGVAVAAVMRDDIKSYLDGSDEAHAAQQGEPAGGLSLRERLARAEQEAESNKKLADGNQRAKNAADKRAGDLQAKVKALEERASLLEASQPSAHLERDTDTGHRRDQPATAGSASGLSPEEVAAIRTKADTLLGDLRGAIESKDKGAALDLMKKLSALGPAAYAQFFAAHDAMNEATNPWEGKNALGFANWEFGIWMTNAHIDYALKDPLGNVPLSARISAVYNLTWSDKERSAAEKIDMLGELLQHATDPQLLDAIYSNLFEMHDPKAASYLSTSASNPALRADLRVRALNALALLGEQADWNVVTHLTNDPEPAVAGAAKRALAARNPAATGFYINWVGENSQAALAGLLVGDILVRYNGVEITNVASLNAAKATVQENSDAPVEVVRNGELVSLVIGPGQIGINGVPVVKK